MINDLPHETEAGQEPGNRDSVRFSLKADPQLRVLPRPPIFSERAVGGTATKGG